MTEIELDYKDVLIKPRASGMRSRSEVAMHSSYSCLWARTPGGDKLNICAVPIIAANMEGVGEIKLADALAKEGAMCVLKKHVPTLDLISFFDSPDPSERETRSKHVMLCVGSSEEEHLRFRTIYEQTSLRMLCIDVANGYLDSLVEAVQMYRRLYPQLIITAGNVCTAEQTQTLLRAGADIVKLGIGPGSVCTTRIETGIGRPQLSTVLDCAKSAHALGGLCIADGGCTTTGDVAKAFVAGADFVMLGGMFAGHKEGGGKVITRIFETSEVTKTSDGFYESVYRSEYFVRFCGSSSNAIKIVQKGELDNYSCSEGKEVEVPFRGWIHSTLAHILGGLRSTCTYVGARSLQNLHSCGSFYRVRTTHNSVFEEPSHG